MKALSGSPNENIRFPHYGDIWDINFNPVIGSEIGKTRPALVVSNDLNNQFADIVTVLPITVVVQGKCQGLLFSNYVSISPRRMNFHRCNSLLPWMA